jgi:predicted nuclease of restriction endonuclease-like RecB superfamily
MNEVVEVFQKHQQDKRRMMLEHLEEIEKFDQLQVAQLLKGVLDDPALVMTQLIDLVKRARIDTVDLCLPEEQPDAD